MSTANSTDYNATYQQQNIKLKRKALVEYADNNSSLSDDERQKFTMDILSNPSFFKQASDTLENITSIMWAAALEEDEDAYAEKMMAFLSETVIADPTLKRMGLFFIRNWEHVFLYPTDAILDERVENSEPVNEENYEGEYNSILTDEQIKQCEIRLLDLQEQLHQH